MRYDNMKEYEFDLAVEALEKEAEKREALRAELKALEEKRFLINMIDHWTNADHNLYCAVTARIKEVKIALA